MTSPREAPGVDRRGFLHATAAAAAVTLTQVPLVHAAGSDTLRIGLVGCGGRGTGAAAQALNADPNVRLVAMGDAFRDRLESSVARLQHDQAIARKIAVPRDKQFVGFDAYQHVIDNVDVVLLATPPHFRPIHIEAAVKAKKHIFAEKPVGVDAPGVRRVMAACREAQRQGTSVVSGLCYRYDNGKRETFRRIHDGAIGDVVAVQSTYNTHGLWHKNRETGWTDMEWQLRNWLYFTWLSGDFNTEQHVHSLDKMAWALRDQHPVKCFGLGGRQVRTGPEYGQIFDHMACVYEFAGGVRGFSFCRQQNNCTVEVSDHILGTRGKADIMNHQITGANPWQYPRRLARADDMYQNEHNAFFAGLRSGHLINNGDYMCNSTLIAIMGRMACYTGLEVTWEQVLNSHEDLSPPRYAWDVPLPVRAVAKPGITTLS